MPTRLYLDTARLGLMSRECPANPHRLRPVRGGRGRFPVLRSVSQRRHSQLGPLRFAGGFPPCRAWQGISHLKEALRRPGRCSAQWQVLLASRSAQLMKLAAELLFRLCRNVLVTDLTWPSYRLILDRAGGRAENQLTTLSLRKGILRAKLQSDELVEQIVRSVSSVAAAMVSSCRPSTISEFALPVERIVRAIKQRAELALRGGGRCPGVLATSRSDLDEQYCDFLIAGCHKWLCAYHPLGTRILWPSAIGSVTLSRPFGDSNVRGSSMTR